MRTGTSLTLIIVSEDWFARAILASTALEAGLFSEVVAVDDGYSALVQTWEGVAEHRPPHAFLVDGDSVGASANALIRELRSDPRTSGACVAVIGTTEVLLQPGINFSRRCGATSEEIESVLIALAVQAAWQRERPA
jgi:hypothetical protein